MNLAALHMDCFTLFAMTTDIAWWGQYLSCVLRTVFNCPHKKVWGRKRNNLLIKSLTKPHLLKSTGCFLTHASGEGNTPYLHAENGY